MITIVVRTAELKSGAKRQRVYVRVVNETIGPLHALTPHVPEISKGLRRTGERVRVNRAGTVAVWRCLDRKRM